MTTTAERIRSDLYRTDSIDDVEHANDQAYIRHPTFTLIYDKKSERTSLTTVFNRAIWSSETVGQGSVYPIHYLECIFTSSSVAHAFMAKIRTRKSSDMYRVTVPDEHSGEALKILPGGPQLPPSMQCYDVKVPYPKGRGHFHHVAAIDRSSGVIFAKDETDLWNKFRNAQPIPTKEEWGKEILTKLFQCGALSKAYSYRVGDVKLAKVNHNAVKQFFNSIVTEYVKKFGF